MVLFLLGIVAAVLFMSKNLSDQVKENFIFKLTLKEVVPDKDIVSIQRALQSKPYVKSVRFVSKDVAVNTPSFFDANFRVAYSFTIMSGVHAEAAAGVQNLFNAYQKDFDRGVNRDSDYIYGPSLPRSYFGSISLNI
jgi:outer membrane receptor for ferrienterochelin and colicins